MQSQIAAIWTDDQVLQKIMNSEMKRISFFQSMKHQFMREDRAHTYISRLE